MIPRLILILIGLLLIPAFWTLQSLLWEKCLRPHFTLFVPWLAVLAGGILMRWLIHRNPNRLDQALQFLDTLEHELCHALVSTLFLRPPRKLTVQDDGNGSVEVQGANTLVVLAPYYTPLYGLLVLILFNIADKSFQSILSYVFALSLGNYCWRLFRELRPHQSDFDRSGYWTSLPLLLMHNSLLILVLICWIGDAPAISELKISEMGHRIILVYSQIFS